MKKIEITTRQWIWFAVVALLYVFFTIWVGNYWLLLGLPLIVDIYLTKFIPWTFWKKSKNKAFRTTMEWVDSILYALVAVYLINTFFFQLYQIPTSSLEKSLLVGDYLFVSKVSYGPRQPMTVLSFPLAQHTLPVVNTKSYLEWIKWPYKRLKGLGQVERDDIMVFNFPAGDSVALKMQNPDYYSLVYYSGYNEVHNNKALYGDIVYRPVDRRENYVKRTIGMPGDTFSIVNNQVYIDGKPIKNPAKMQFNYYVMTDGTQINDRLFRQLGVSQEDRYLMPSDARTGEMLNYMGFEFDTLTGKFDPVYRFPLTDKALEQLKGYKFVKQIIAEPGEFGGPVYPLGKRLNWSRSNYGPLWIPQKGETIELTPENVDLYARVIRNYEGHTLEKGMNGGYLIDGNPARNYTFEMDYYFMLGDNRDNSADSRFWGFVPEDHVVGRPLFVITSLDKDRTLFDGKIRWNRTFKNVVNE